MEVNEKQDQLIDPMYYNVLQIPRLDFIHQVSLGWQHSKKLRMYVPEWFHTKIGWNPF